MNPTKKILVSGASIAGPTLAYWLHYYGFDVTIVERFPELRLGGQNVDVKGPALEVIRKMNLEDAVREANTTEVGLRFVNQKNETLAEFSKESALSMTQELEILRGDLVNILYEHTKADVRYIFGDYIKDLNEQPEHMEVTFNSGKTEVYNLVISAEGIGSNTRNLVFKERVKFKYLGVYTAYLTIQKAATDSRWARWCNAPEGIVFMMRPDSYGTTRASITFLSPEKGYEKLRIAEQKQVLIDKIKNAGWEAGRLTKEISKSEDLYFERVSQVKAPLWHKGRFAMTGDAAYCATPISGKGIDLSMSGAYILAGELSMTDDYEKAFTKYENRMRGYVESSQKLPPGIPGIVYPTSGIGVNILNGLFSLVGSKPVQKLISLFTSKNKAAKSEIELPDYR
ncbi:FAD-dependent monooxygenase [Pedobacter duraquae]|uniref:2-polyprenyl-6-methoxyphenol hydroxylase-like FAD-dependent oxidoreductase n=1 Tax=Pedobacter duraquae TaxID=425511 RepID=A0A4V3C2Q9_9SPHI|nr:FAD-dependent monooxygenase [Pedobacter duraquae]TDO19319.1 2-polyprenyl-6-methoxyphenol hydroxylase-like FAD-dependent oxidoreductase [Pedobacter duraquae]